MALLRQATAYTRAFLLVQASDHITPLTGASPTVNISKAGGAFGAAAGAVSEISVGWYKVALSTVDTGTLGDLAYHVTAASGDNTDFVDQVVAIDLTDAVRLGLTALPNANAGASGGLPTGNSSGQVTVGSIAGAAINVKKNQALAAFEFLMTDSTNHAPKTGLTVTATRSLDGGAFGSATNAVAEVGVGVYKIDLAAADLNASTITLRFTATGADDQVIGLITTP